MNEMEAGEMWLMTKVNMNARNDEKDGLRPYALEIRRTERF